jgi:HlyD family secretion protein
MNKRLEVAVPVLLVLGAVTAWLILRPRGSDENALVASGTVEATEADLGFQAGGRVQQVEVREGDDVRAGQKLANLDLTEIQAVRDGAAAQVTAAQARLTELERGARSEEIAQAEAAHRASVERADAARREAERARNLFQGGAVSRQVLDNAETALETATAARDQAAQALALVREGPRPELIAQQRAMVEQARANLERADATLANAVIVAPFAGRVTVQHRQPGETVMPGAPVLTILDPQDRWVRIYVREDEIGRVHIGMPAEIRSDTYPDRTYPGEVVFIASEAEFTPRNVQTSEERIRLVYAVKVRLTGDAEFELKPGIPADVTLIESVSHEL